MKFPALASALFFSVASGSAPAIAQTPAAAKPEVATGATVYGPQGNVVGTIGAVTQDTAVLDTGTHSATLPKAAFGAGAKGLTVTQTRDQINAAIDAANQAAAAQIAAALTPGAPLRSSDGVPLGTIKSLNADGTVVVDREAGAVALKRELFATDANGLIVRLTAQQLNSAIGQTADEANAN